MTTSLSRLSFFGVCIKIDNGSGKGAEKQTIRKFANLRAASRSDKIKDNNIIMR